MINNPSGLYGGGAFRVDSSAAVNYYLKRQAEEQAKQAALDKYFTHLMDKASPTGLRTDKEGAAFQQSIKNAQNFYTLNKKAITGGDIAAQQKYMELTNLPFQIMAASKEALATSKIAGQIGGSNTTARDRWDNNTTGIDIETGQPVVDANGNYMGLYAHEQSTHIINPDGSVTANPKFKMFDPMQIKLNPEIYDTKKFQDNLDNSLTMFKPEDISSTVIPDPNKKNYEIPVIEKGFKKETLQKYGDTVRNVLTSDPAMKATLHKLYPYQTWPLQNQNEFEKLNKVYNDIYGSDIKNESDLGVALQLAPRMNTTKELGQSQLSENAKHQLAFQWQMAYHNATQKLDPADIATINNTQLAFDRITPGQYGNVKIDKNGVVRNLDGTPYTSPNGMPSVDIDLQYLNPEIIDAFPSGIKLRQVKGIKAIVENGRIKYAGIEGRGNKNFGTIDQQSLLNKQVGKKAAVVPLKTVTSSQKTPASKTGGVNIPGMKKSQ